MAIQVLGWVGLRLSRATHSYAPTLLFGAPVALVAAAAAFVLLRRLQAPDDTEAPQVTEIFT